MASLYDRRFLFITGKGGVGKTTVTAALALAFAARGKRVLCAACNAKERFSTLFETAPVGAEIMQLAENIWGVNMDPAQALQEYGQMMLKSRMLYRVVFDNKYVHSFFRATPGLYEWAMLGKAWWHTTEALPGALGNAHRFDVVLLDAPATGHGLDMLRVPKVLTEIAPPGILRRDAERAWAMFRDPAQAGVVVVTLPEEMPVTETLELTQGIGSELGLPLALGVVNDLLPQLFAAHEREALLVPRPWSESDLAGAALAAGVRRAAREQIQYDSLLRLQKAIQVPWVHLPHLFHEVASLAAARELAGVLISTPASLAR